MPAANGKPKILIVDDIRLNLKMVSGLLAGFDAELLEAQSGREALSLAWDNDLALVLLDVMMPGMDGFEVAQRLRSDPRSRHVPIIFVTALGTERENLFRGYESGAVDYLIKPFDPAVLRGKVRVFLHLFTQRMALETAAQRLQRTVDDLRRSESALASSEERYRIVAENTHDLESWISPDGDYLYVSPSCERITGYPAEMFLTVHGHFDGLVYPDDLDDWHVFLDQENAWDTAAVDVRIRHRTMGERWINAVRRRAVGGDGTYLGLRCSIRDISERKAMELQLRHQAYHDILTNLPNRRYCFERVREVIRQVRERPDQRFALAFMGLDRFRQTNESLGHASGDHLLVRIGGRLLEAAGDGAMVFRFGGDEYVLLFDDLKTHRDAIQGCRRILAAISRPFDIGGFEIQISASTGMVFSRRTEVSAEDLLHNANLAMRRAKQFGSGHIQSFKARMRDEAKSALLLEHDMRQAIRNNEFHLVFQPVVDMRSGCLEGFEALIRWTHPERGLICPAQFIPLAEESGMIIPIGDFVIREACRILRGWRDARPAAEELTVAVNLSGRQFEGSKLAERIREVMAEHGLPSHCLKLEIVETVLMDDAKRSVAQLAALHDLGLRLSVDDFGTGYSSLSYLQRFPLDDLKIDLSFVRGMDKSAEDYEIVKTIIGLAHGLNLKVIAEGIERPTQRDMLADLGCDFGQGYLFSPPLAEPDAESFIRMVSRPGKAVPG